jgi:hypothetical protein
MSRRYAEDIKGRSGAALDRGASFFSLDLEHQIVDI